MWVFDDTPALFAGRIKHRLHEYISSMIPPMAAALFKYSTIYEYSFAAPGHQGGAAFRKTTVGRTLYDFYDENLFRSDMGIERTQLGSLLEHTGPMGQGERYAAHVFGADASYSGVVGTSGSNRTLFTACLTEGDIALCDRNCHKSIEQGLIITGAVPVYLCPSRNRFGIIGPIYPERLAGAAIQAAVAANPLAAAAQAAGRQPIYSVVTNCTYDGLCYDAAAVARLLRETASLDFTHFDEAWFGYARFHPLYHNR